MNPVLLEHQHSFDGQTLLVLGHQHYTLTAKLYSAGARALAFPLQSDCMVTDIFVTMQPS